MVCYHNSLGRGRIQRYGCPQIREKARLQRRFGAVRLVDHASPLFTPQYYFNVHWPSVGQPNPLAPLWQNDLWSPESKKALLYRTILAASKNSIYPELTKQNNVENLNGTWRRLKSGLYLEILLTTRLKLTIYHETLFWSANLATDYCFRLLPFTRVCLTLLQLCPIFHQIIEGSSSSFDPAFINGRQWKLQIQINQQQISWIPRICECTISIQFYRLFFPQPAASQLLAFQALGVLSIHCSPDRTSLQKTLLKLSFLDFMPRFFDML